MNKKEIAEIKKLMSEKNCNVQQMSCCIVNGKQEIKHFTTGSLLTRTEEEIAKFLKLHKDAFSGGVGKKVFDMKTTGDLSLLEKMRRSELREGCDEFCNKVADSFATGENYLIQIIQGNYDVPKSDGAVYRYIHVVICPIETKDPGLAYTASGDIIENAIKTQAVGKPVFGFLYPAFNDRAEDCSEALTYVKKEMADQLFSECFCCEISTPADAEKEVFVDALNESVSDPAVIRDIHNGIYERTKTAENDTYLDEDSLTAIFTESGVSDEAQDIFFSKMSESSLKGIHGANVSDKKTKIEMGDTSVLIPTDAAGSVMEIREVDGRKYIMLMVTDEIKINGVTCK